MKKLYNIGLLACTLLLMVGTGYGQNDLVITAIFDGPRTGGLPKGVEIYVINDVPDLSLYGIGSANNGGGTDGVEFVFSGSATAGSYLYVASEEPEFNNYFGFTPTFDAGSVMGINGDDAIELFYDVAGTPIVVDTYGDISSTSGSWIYLDGWAYRNNFTGPDGAFNAENWTFSGANALDICGSSGTNATCSSVIPVGTYVYSEEVDETAPTFITDYPSATEVTGNGFNVNAQLDEPGQVFYVVVANDASAPTATQIAAGTDANDVAPIASGTIAVAETNTTYSAVVTGVTGETDYDVYFLPEDDEDTPNRPIEGTKVDVLTGPTDNTAPVHEDTSPDENDNSPYISNVQPREFDLTIRLDEVGTAYYVVVTDGSSAGITAEQVIAGTDASDQAALTSGMIEITAASQNFTVTAGGNLPTGTDLDVYVVVMDDETTPNVSTPTFRNLITAVDNIAPELVSAATGAATVTNTIALTFDEDVQATDATGFSVSINAEPATISDLTVDGSSITLTIDEEIFVDDVVVLNYAAGNVQDVNGNAFGTLTDQAVTNNATTVMVADLAELRAQPTGTTVYYLAGTAVVHTKQSFRNQKWIQDATTAILIDDAPSGNFNPGYLTTDYAVGDEIPAGLRGNIALSGGILQYRPLQGFDPGPPVSSDNVVTPQVVSLTEFNTNYENYESELITVTEVRFQNAGSSFANGASYTIEDDATTGTYRTNIFEFTGQNQPYGRVDITAPGGRNFTTPQISGRAVTDFADNYAPEFTVAPAAQNVSFFTAEIRFTSDEPGTVYYLVVADGATAPTNEEIMTNGTSAPMSVEATTLNLTDLDDNTLYDVYILLADGALSNVQETATQVDVDTPELTFDADSDVTPTDPQIEALQLSSVDEDGAAVMSFVISDAGGDLSPTIITGGMLVPGAQNTADWATTLEAVALEIPGPEPTFLEGAINEDGHIVFDATMDPLELPDGESIEMTLYIEWSTTVTHGEVLQFEIPASGGITADGTQGSTFPATLPGGAVISAAHTMVVVATEFEVEVASTVPLAEDFELTVTAVDAYGNVATNFPVFRPITLSVETGGANLSSATGLTDKAMTNGVYTWTDLQLSTAGEYTLTVTDGILSTTTGTITALQVVNGPAQLLITEIVVSPTGGEFIEIYNNSADVVALDDYYITDATFAGGSTYYYNIVTGTNAGGGDFGDWHARFPQGSLIQPGEVQTISLAGSDDFTAAYGENPTYELFEDGTEADAVPDMLEATEGSINNQGGLTDSGEIVMLYYWDGETDLVTDIDYVMWGDQAEAIDKSGVAIDGPDADTDATTYQNDLATSSQVIISATTHASGNSWQRVDYSEGTEVKTGGNGVDGHNEMTENLNETFIEDVASPGSIIEAGAPLITLVTASFNSNFGYVENGVSSEPSSYVVSGADLLGDIIVTPPVGFELSGTVEFDGTIYTNSSPWTIAQVDGVVAETTIYVRFTPPAADAGTYSGNITHESTDATTKNVAVSGIEGEVQVNSLSGIVINEILYDPNGTYNYDTDGSGTAATEDEFVEIFNTSESPVDISGWQLWDESASAFFTFPAETVLGAGKYAAVMGPVQTGGTLPTPAEGNFAYTSSLSLSNSGENVALFDPNSNSYVQVKFGATEADAAISGLSSATIVGIIEAWGTAVSGSSLVRSPEGGSTIVNHADIQGAESASFAAPAIDPNAPRITSSGEEGLHFGNLSVGITSETQTYTVSGINLVGDIAITAPDGFELSSNGTDFSGSLVLTPTANVVEETTITVRFTPDSFGSKDGVITHTTEGALQIDIDVTGAGIEESTIYFETFAGCDTGVFTAVSVTGAQEWRCASTGETGNGYLMSGFASGAQENEDWLIGAFDLTDYSSAEFSFDSEFEFGGPALEVYASTDYSGNPTTATWTALSAVLDENAAENTWTNSDAISLLSYVGSTVYIGFKYTSNTTDAPQWIIDNVLVNEIEAFLEANSAGFNGDFQQQEIGTFSQAASFTVNGFGLTENVSVTPPAGYEVSLANTFATVGTNGSPLSITATDGMVDNVTVFVRFAPTAEQTYSGNIVVASAGFDNVNLAVTGAGIQTTTGIADELGIKVYPNPNRGVFTIANESGRAIAVELYSLEGARMTMQVKDGQYDISALNAGLYILMIKDAKGNHLGSERILKK